MGWIYTLLPKNPPKLFNNLLIPWTEGRGPPVSGQLELHTAASSDHSVLGTQAE